MENIPIWVFWTALAVCLIGSGFFSGTETSFMAVNRFRLKHKAQKGDKKAERVMKLLENPDRFLVLVLIGNNLVNILASSIATILAMHYFGQYGFAMATFFLTLFILIFGEITPKTVAALRPEKVAGSASLTVSILMKAASPLVTALNMISKVVVSAVGVKSQKRDDASLSIEELKFALSGESGNIISKQHRDLLLGVIDLEKVSVDEIMVPRSDLYAIDINDEWEDIKRQVTNTPHTRVLFYREEINDIVGFMHSRDALRILTKEDFTKENLLRAIEEPYFIPENTSLLTQLQKFRRNRERCGIVVNEFGDIQGLVTLDDILEEIVGDFTTSLAVDIEEEMEKQKDGSYILDGQANVREINKELGWDIPSNGNVTINGVILEALGDNPRQGTDVVLGRYKATILKTNGSTVLSAKLAKLRKGKTEF